MMRTTRRSVPTPMYIQSSFLRPIDYPTGPSGKRAGQHGLTFSSHLTRERLFGKEVGMGLIDWLRGGSRETRDTQEERTETASPHEATTPEVAEDVDARIEAEHDEEAMRHRGM